MNKSEEVLNLIADLQNKLNQFKDYTAIYNPVLDTFTITYQDQSFLINIENVGLPKSKLDEYLKTMGIAVAELNLDQEQEKQRRIIDTIMKENDIIIEQEELEYYNTNLDIFKNPIQKVLVNSYFHSLNINTSTLTKREYIKAIILMKKILINKHNLALLPYIISSICIHTIQMDKADNIINSLYNEIINSEFTFVDYDDPDSFGMEITIHEELLKDEIMIFMTLI
jgi:hypothetical protein